MVAPLGRGVHRARPDDVGDRLAGALPARLLAAMLERRWLTRTPSSRALWLTDAGRSGLRAAFGYDPP